MKNLILIVILINPFIGYTQYKFDMSNSGTGIDNYPEQKESKITKVKTDTIPKSVIIIKDTTKFEKNIELVRDDSYNAKIFQKIISVEEKIDQLDLIFT